MEEVDIVRKCLDNVALGLEKSDTVNKRLITCIIAVCISFSMCISSIAYFYFYADYDYIDAYQEVTTEDSETEQSFKTGGD